MQACVMGADSTRLKICESYSNGMDAPTRNGIDVPKWKCHRPLEPRGAST